MVAGNLNPGIELSNQQMAVVTLTAMRMGKNGFPRSTFLEKINEGKLDEAGNWLLLQTSEGEIRKTGDEPKQYFYVLRLLWEEKVMIEELLDLPMFSYKGIPVTTMYGENGKHQFNDNIWYSLKKGYGETPRTALELE